MKSYIEKYNLSHQDWVNRFLHSIGIPMIVVSIPILFWEWRLALVLFVLGWILQFVGHWFEGKPPAFFSDPFYLLIGPVWLLRKIVAKIFS